MAFVDDILRDTLYCAVFARAGPWIVVIDVVVDELALAQRICLRAHDGASHRVKPHYMRRFHSGIAAVGLAFSIVGPHVGEYLFRVEIFRRRRVFDGHVEVRVTSVGHRPLHIHTAVRTRRRVGDAVGGRGGSDDADVALTLRRTRHRQPQAQSVAGKRLVVRHVHAIAVAYTARGASAVEHTVHIGYTRSGSGRCAADISPVH